MQVRYFSELDLGPIRDSLVILDIDGTLLADAAQTPDEATIRAARQLSAQGNMVYLCSNGFSHKAKRNQELADSLQATYYAIDYKKPLKYSFLPLVRGTTKPVVVIGDKFLTDGLLAVGLGVPYLRVRSLRTKKDSLYVKLAYRIDDLATALCGGLARGPWYQHHVYRDGNAQVVTILTEPPLTIVSLPHTFIRWLRATVKHLLFKLTRQTRYLPYGGPSSVIRSLRRGLFEINASYRFDPWQHKVTETVGVIRGIATLRWAIEQKKKGFIRTIVAGPNIVVTPLEDDHLIQEPEIDRIVVPSQWNKNWWVSFDQALEQRITPWAAGVTDHGTGRDAKGVCIIYAKQADEKLFHKIIESLWTHKLPIVVSNYGQFMQHEYFRILKKARMMVYLSDFESQGIAIHEAWMADVPTLIYDGGEMRYADYVWYDSNIAAPYFDPQCGISFKNFEDFESRLIEFMEKYDSFTPRRYSLAHFTNTICARKYIDIVEEAARKNNYA